jgi:hypothetical protein
MIASTARIKPDYNHPTGTTIVQSYCLPVIKQHYCARPLSQILSFTPANRRCWLRQVKLARTNQQSQCRISQFFNSTDTIPVPSVDPTTVPSYKPPPLPAPPPREESIRNLFHPAQPE